jgi:hypothetical protein
MRFALVTGSHRRPRCLRCSVIGLEVIQSPVLADLNRLLRPQCEHGRSLGADDELVSSDESVIACVANAAIGVLADQYQTATFCERSVAPNAPKVGSGGSLSPRGDWRAPSDASARAWLDELEAHVP